MQRSNVSRQVVATALEAIVRQALPADVRAQIAADSAVESFESMHLGSIDRLSVAGRVNTFFGIHEKGIEDNLLRSSRVGEWVDIAMQALDRDSPYIAFETSGTTGQPKRVHTPLAALEQEIEHLAELFAGAKRIVSTVQARHIYGFLFSAMLPARLGIPRVEVGSSAMSFWRNDLITGDLVVSFPEYLSFVADFQVDLPGDVTIVTSTAPCPPEIWERLDACGITDMREVYGSTETVGIGIRRSPEAPFELFPYYERAAGETELLRTFPDGQVQPVPLMDSVHWADDRHITPVGRKDLAVNVGGEKVYAEQVESIIAAHPDVEWAEVRINASGNRLSARVKLTDDAEEGNVTEWIDRKCSSVQRPRPVEFLRGN